MSSYFASMVKSLQKLTVKIYVLIVPGLLCLVLACKQHDPDAYPYQPNDFSPPVSDILKKIEQYNIVYLIVSGCRGGGEIWDSSEVYYNQLASKASRKELVKASKCSNPSIRASAAECLLRIKDADAATVIREHLYDTAIIFDDYYRDKWTVISFLAQNSYYWKSKADRDKIEQELLEKMPFEKCSYYLLNPERRTDTFPGFYTIVRKMAAHLLQQIDTDWYTGIWAVEKLASYQKREDIPLLDSLFAKSLYRANGNFYPFKSIKLFPAPEFDKYYLDTSIYWPRQLRFLHWSKSEEFYNPEAGFRNFINLVVKRKSARSAMLLENIFHYADKLNMRVPYGEILEIRTEDFYRKTVARVIRQNPSPHYQKLLLLTKDCLNKNELGHLTLQSENRDEIPTPPSQQKPDNSKKFEAHWFQ